MDLLIAEQPDTLTNFRRWAERAAAELQTLIDADESGELETELNAQVARLIRRAKRHAFNVGLYDVADKLPERPFKTPLDGLLRLRECLGRESDNRPTAQFLTIREVAAMLAINERSVRRRVTEGTLPEPVRIGRSVRWRRLDIENCCE